MYCVRRVYSAHLSTHPGSCMLYDIDRIRGLHAKDRHKMVHSQAFFAFYINKIINNFRGSLCCEYLPFESAPIAHYNSDFCDEGLQNAAMVIKRRVFFTV